MCAKFYRNRTFSFKVMIKKKNQFQMKNLGFRSDNPGKKGWDSLSNLVQKVSPFPPMKC